MGFAFGRFSVGLRRNILELEASTEQNRLRFGRQLHHGTCTSMRVASCWRSETYGEDN